ncbi:hypothetical protein [Sphingosinicella rhizophila]|uniref:Uncharacterized protein n=1 Tax=Sphingosinicella rhizophila TaxID=3050082 RepID=A0ABU3Q6Y5_9SPHN|nr:hypothetical protein [Sphingosinicella sp. GR2756]MDT9599154.1 hypothetical protein [Sphingosinicella sp. GR2756]
MRNDDRDYHVQRARAELDSAYRAPNNEAAASHLRLSALHMERARSLGSVARPHRLQAVSG